MGLHATLRRSGGLDALSRRLSIPPADVASAAARLLPPLLARYRHAFEQAGGGEAGVRALGALSAPFGGGSLAMTIHAAAEIPPDAPTGLLGAVLSPGESVQTLIAEAGSADTVAGEQMTVVLPLLNLLVGAYFTARAEAAGAGDIAAEFETLLNPA